MAGKRTCGRDQLESQIFQLMVAIFRKDRIDFPAKGHFNAGLNAGILAIINYRK